MKPIVLAVALAAMATPVLAEPAYDAAYYDQLTGVGLEREAFLYAFRWASDGSTDAEIAVAYALLDGFGVEENPIAAIVIACRSKDISEFELGKIIVKANLRLVGSVEYPVRCGVDGG
ncbi:hypothetical protein [Yoonia sp.]|uniref:hypothetical protein n=1 Tax=Yoonia sp. TaxID=2212373 RepID=UPI003F6F675D